VKRGFRVLLNWATLDSVGHKEGTLVKRADWFAFRILATLLIMKRSSRHVCIHRLR
jgi:hypothetical protein